LLAYGWHRSVAELRLVAAIAMARFFSAPRANDDRPQHFPLEPRFSPNAGLA
jgi:hypothetical protein